ncbi:hypothetical protein LG325_09595 [Marinobacter nauticus]
MTQTQQEGPLPTARSQGTKASQKDLFGLSQPMPGGAATSTLEAIAQLSRVGIRVHREADNHWILHGREPLPEIHCYSERELRQMAHSDARHHLTRNSGKPR